MDWRRYLPSAQFSLIAISLFCSVGLVYAAQQVTRQPLTTAELDPSQTNNGGVVEDNWQQALAQVQMQSGTAMPQAPDATAVQAMLKAASSSNMTDSLGRTILVNLANAKAQGLGDDIPTQNQIISDALSHVPQTSVKSYALTDLTIASSSSKSAIHDYANALMVTLNVHTKASMQETLVIVGTAIDSQNSDELKKLVPIEADYDALTKDLLKVSVPQTLSPLHLQIVNNFSALTESYTDMAHLIDDPVRGLAGMQNYRALTGETRRVFTNVAQEFVKDGILFASGEPGAGWAALASQPQQ
jgi:hypothetical protein